MSAKEWFAGENRQPTFINLPPSDMVSLTDAPAEKKASKLPTGPIAPVEAEPDMKEQVIGAFHRQTQQINEREDQVLKQDLMEGVDASEWD